MIDLRRAYIELLKSAVRNTLYGAELPVAPTSSDLDVAKGIIANLVDKFGERAPKVDPTTVLGVIQRSRPAAHTLADQAQVDNVQEVIERVLAGDVPGDLIEAGVFRGGMTILMRGVLKAHGVTNRRVFVADSFLGLPSPTKLEDAIAHEVLRFADHFRVSAADVRDTFERYDLLDNQVVFLEGWFRDTLPGPIERLAVIRLDGDYYESTADAIAALYPKLSVGGFVIVDDYGMPVGCKRAIDEYRERHKITSPLIPIRGRGFPEAELPASVYWQRE